ncbi:MAG: plasmid mobilization relaxosome protein MobC [Proteobacteria bacterium]|nr:plasmid mobilization relaxosome protein MobC [Pseudomonadota bacterium]
MAHLNKQRAQLARPRGPSNELVREFRRIGNNLNQLARQANLGLVAVSSEEIERCIAELNALAARL